MKKTLLIIIALTMASCASTQDNSAYLYPKHDPNAECYKTLTSGKVIYLHTGNCQDKHLMSEVNGNFEPHKK